MATALNARVTKLVFGLLGSDMMAFLCFVK